MSGRHEREIIVAALTLGASLAIVLGFFLPWMEGSNELASRSFSGADFARLIRNFEITATTESESGQIRAAAIAIYLMPALAGNAAVLALLASPTSIPRRFAGGGAALAGAYGILVLGALLFLSVVEVNDFADVVGAPRYGFVLSALACAALLIFGLSKMSPEHPSQA